MTAGQDLNVGVELPTRTVPVDRQRLRAYAEASGDHNPIHQDEAFARSVGLPDVIAHGMLTMGVAMAAVADWVGDPAAVLGCSTRFTKPVVVPADEGAEIEVSGTVTAVDEEAGRATIAVTVTSGGVKVLGRALAEVRR